MISNMPQSKPAKKTAAKMAKMPKARRRRRAPKTLRPKSASALVAAPAEPMARPWRVSEAMLAKTDDVTLKPILRDLILAEAARCGCDLATVNTEDRAKDQGSDAMTPAPARPSVWFGSVQTCWQFKAGTAGQPSKL